MEMAPEPAGAALAHCLNVQQDVVHVSAISGYGLLVYVALIFVNLFFFFFFKKIVFIYFSFLSCLF